MDQNLYLKYKRDQRLLVYWITHTSAQIIEQHPSESVAANTTGVVSLAALKSLSKLIAKHVHEVPATILRLFESIIHARKATHKFFLKITTTKPDPDLLKSNETHQHWINGLTEAFNALGGDKWSACKKSESETPAEDEDQVIFANKFSTLSLGSPEQEGRPDDDGDDCDSEDAEGAEYIAATGSRRSKQKATVKMKKHGRRRKAKTKGKAADTAPSPGLRDVPLESYRIMEDGSDKMTDYLMAVCSLTKQMVELRHYLQGVWRQVAYEGLNSAVAANLCNVAIGMIKNTESHMFLDFPDHDSFHTIMQTLTRGDPDKAQGMFQVQSGQHNPDGACEKVQEHDIQVREEFFLHSYQDLFDFVTDYQKTRSGKPTKAMLKKIQNWDPKFDLQRATKEARLQWRRAFTINWLYDLVNLFSAVVNQQPPRGQTIPLETVDWSTTGPWNKHRRLFGINEFAGDITHLAVQKPGTDVRSQIRPHHVFQLQCIVDSLVVSRGWSVGIIQGHVLDPPASKFQPLRDVDLFMDREAKSPFKSFCNSVKLLVEVLEEDSMRHRDPSRNASLREMVVNLCVGFMDWLGQSKYLQGLKGSLPSRFSNTTSNGFWEYCPFLCGAGLAEALDLSYGMGLFIWDNVPEPMCILHLHNMLVQKGLLARPVGLWGTLEFIFRDSFFVDEKIPTADFSSAFEARVGGVGARREAFQDHARRRQVARQLKDANDLPNSSTNRFFKTNSLQRVFRFADWSPDRIPDEEISLANTFAFIRLAEVKQTRDPVTGKVTIADTDLVRRARSQGMKDEDIIELSNKLSAKLEEADKPSSMKSLQAHSPEGSSSGAAPGVPGKRNNISVRAYMNALKHDFMADVCGDVRPLSSLNYIMVVARCNMLFLTIEDRLRACRNPSWVQAYERHASSQLKRVSLTVVALRERDEECLRVMSEVFEEQRGPFIDHVYWDDLLDSDAIKGALPSSEDNPFNPDSCSVM